MKRLVVVSLLILAGFSACYRPPRDEQFKYKYVAPYSVAWIQNNWNEYFVNSLPLLEGLPCRIFPLRLDGYGSIYPDDTILRGMTAKQFNSGNRKYQNNLSFYNLFSDQQDVFCDNFKQIKDQQRLALYKSLFEDGNDDPIDTFCNRWDRYFIPRFCNELNEELKRYNKHKVLFFIHGYNVPYSLATVQCMEFVKLAMRDSIDMSDYLVMPVYWPSNDMKNMCVDSSNINTLNWKKLENGRRWGYYSNRAYYAALTLRQIIKVSPILLKYAYFLTA